MDKRERQIQIIRAESNPELRAVLKERCKRDPLFWFDNFCWTFDPRKEPAILPFNLYPYQREFVKELMKAIDYQYDLGIEKSRDMGVSWVIALVFMWCWMFKPGYNFHIGSRKEDEVDKRGNISTLMEKVRFNLGMQPWWLKPDGWKAVDHDNHCRLLNPSNNNVISGEAACPNFGRGGRFRAVLLDEFPFWPNAEGAWASVSQSTRCRIVNGTPFGKANKYGQLMNDPDNEVVKLGV